MPQACPQITLRYDPEIPDELDIEFFPSPDTWVFSLSGSREELSQELSQVMQQFLADHGNEPFDEERQSLLRVTCMRVLLGWVAQRGLYIPAPLS